MPTLLECDEVYAGYGRVEVLHGLSLVVPAGSVVAILGPNGVGKTTTMNVISGAIPISRGRVLFDGVRLNNVPADERARRGVTLIPEGRGVFPGLSVIDNLLLAGTAAGRGSDREAALERVFTLFPRLAERRQQRAGTLSGGEQQMLALSRALLASPRVLLMDEISMGLAPAVVARLFEVIADLRAEGLTIVLVEQYLTYALDLADICYVLRRGAVDFVGEPEELRHSPALAKALAS
ncbi:MAG TPA: ABC transporter ATP-binding protein [Mycobacteriales bacterium]|jgi:branched-chain amino acid transport system ATP-binding protein|nr:ABC transporter ATP-binding protein [Mycobacteriales bacterium]